MKIFWCSLAAYIVLSAAQQERGTTAPGHQAQSSGRTRSDAPVPLRSRKKDPPPIHFDIYEHVQFEVFERGRFSILPDPPWTFNITIGNQRRHIGEWPPVLMRDQMSVALKETCGWKTGWGANTCDSKVWHARVEYANKRLDVSTDENVVAVRIASDYIPEAYGETVQNILIDQIADIFMMAALDDKNCYTWDRKSHLCEICLDFLCKKLKGDKRGTAIRWCNAPEYVRVAIVDKAGSEQAHMRVELDLVHTKDQRDKALERGKFDCVAIINAVGDGVRANGTESKIRDVTKAAEVKTAVLCPEKEVTGSCPNEDCRYKPGICFKGQKNTGF